ncbi:MAG: tripartite tricarboxylate transporter substrate-binding protein [Burkholderiaceae bacterium]|nr:tripartite tricarboxylate transporter substrate-binding protein [Burkholderiaceae bacterium]MDO9089658.1 tripartite tricarboxylate transporter substrate-binding protein [Burkholderiaceae bacterium]MDP1967982.1 tripartite tricarboxylate transporter substrate-binding protein [Burkholderiaceae bacterium]
MQRRKFLGVFTSAMASSIAMPAVAQQGFPSRTIRVILPSPPGGSTQIMLRPLQDAIQRALGQPVITEYKPGASGITGTLEIARAAPDGHTLGFIWNGPMGLGPVLRPDVGYDTVLDFAPISIVGRAPGVIIANPGVPNDLAGFIAYVKSQPPGTVGCANAGMDSAGHFWARKLAERAGIELLHVPYKSTNEAVPALVSGDVKIMFSGASSMINNLVKDKRLKLMAVASAAPSSMFPGTDLVSKAVPGFTADIWYGMVAPKGTPREIVQRIQKLVAQQLEDSATRKAYYDTSCEPVGTTPEQMAEAIRAERAYWQEFTRGVKIKA